MIEQEGHKEGRRLHFLGYALLVAFFLTVAFPTMAQDSVDFQARASCIAAVQYYLDADGYFDFHESRGTFETESEEQPRTAFDLIGVFELDEVMTKSGEQARNFPLLLFVDTRETSEGFFPASVYFDFLTVDGGGYYDESAERLYINYHYYLDRGVSLESLQQLQDFFRSDYETWQYYTGPDAGEDVEDIVQMVENRIRNFFSSLSEQQVVEWGPLFSSLDGVHFGNRSTNFGDDMRSILDEDYPFEPSQNVDFPEVDASNFSHEQARNEDVARALLGLDSSVEILPYFDMAMAARGGLLPEESWITARATAGNDSIALARNIDAMFKTILHETIHGVFPVTNRSVEYRGHTMTSREYYFRFALNNYENEENSPLVREVLRRILYGYYDPIGSDLDSELNDQLLPTDSGGIGLIRLDNGEYERITSENIDEYMPLLLASDRTHLVAPHLYEVMPSLFTGLFRNCVTPNELGAELRDLADTVFSDVVMSNENKPISLSVLSENLHTSEVLSDSELGLYEDYLDMDFFTMSSSLNSLTGTDHGLPTLSNATILYSVIKSDTYWNTPLALNILDTFGPHDTFYGDSLTKRAYQSVIVEVFLGNS